MTRAQMMRMIWIDMFVATGEFGLQRAHLCAAFDISVPQASIDLRQFMALFPGRLVYDPSEKRYRAAPGSQAPFAEADHSAIAWACSRAAACAERLAKVEAEG